MTNKQFSKKILNVLSIFTILLASSCLTTSVDFIPLTYTGDKLLYPAVYSGVSKSISGAYFNTCDIYNNHFVVKNIEALDGLNKRKFDLDISLVNGSIEYDIINGQLYNNDTHSWSENNSYLFFSKNNFYSRINSQIEQIMYTEGLYNSAKVTAVSDPLFLYSILDSMNDLRVSDFVENGISDQKYKITGTVSNVEESGKNIDGTVYLYRVQITQDIDDIFKASGSSLRTASRLTYFYYTNEKSFISYNKGSEITVNAKIQKISERNIAGYILTAL